MNIEVFKKIETENYPIYFRNHLKEDTISLTSNNKDLTHIQKTRLSKIRYLDE